MKLVTYASANRPEVNPRVGALVAGETRVVDLARAHQLSGGGSATWFPDMLSLLAGGEPALDETRRLIDWSQSEGSPEVLLESAEAHLIAPVPVPNSIRDCMSFERHLVQSMRTVARWRAPWFARLDAWLARGFGRGLLRVPAVWREQPIYYKGNPGSVVGPEAVIRWPRACRKLDYECELGAFIGRQGRDIPAGEAEAYIAGYTIFNDFSARDVQLREMQGRLGPAKGKDFDTGNALGPFLLTRDEMPDAGNLKMLARVNGETWTKSSSRGMNFSFPEIVAYVSRDETLYPGDFIAAGTCPDGCGLELDRWLQPGDVVELEVERLGVLRNRMERWEPT